MPVFSNSFPTRAYSSTSGQVFAGTLFLSVNIKVLYPYSGGEGEIVIDHQNSLDR